MTDENFKTNILGRIGLPSDAATLGGLRKRLSPSLSSHDLLGEQALRDLLGTEEEFALRVCRREECGPGYVEPRVTELPVEEDVARLRAELATAYVFAGLAPGKKSAERLVDQLERAVVRQAPGKGVA